MSASILPTLLSVHLLTIFRCVAGTGDGNMSMTPGNTATRSQTDVPAPGNASRDLTASGGDRSGRTGMGTGMGTGPGGAANPAEGGNAGQVQAGRQGEHLGPCHALSASQPSGAPHTAMHKDQRLTCVLQALWGHRLAATLSMRCRRAWPGAQDRCDLSLQMYRTCNMLCPAQHMTLKPKVTAAGHSAAHPHWLIVAGCDGQL